MLAGAMHPRLADGNEEIVHLGHLEALTVEDLVFEEDDGVGIANGALEQTLGVGGGVGHHHLEAGDLGVPGREVLAVLGADAGGRAIGAAEHDGRTHLAA